MNSFLQLSLLCIAVIEKAVAQSENLAEYKSYASTPADKASWFYDDTQTGIVFSKIRDVFFVCILFTFLKREEMAVFCDREN